MICKTMLMASNFQSVLDNPGISDSAVLVELSVPGAF